MTDKLWPFGSLSNCAHLCCNTWFDLDGIAYPEGLPFTEGSIDFEWSCQAIGAAAVAPLIGTASDASTGELYFWLSDRLLNENNLPLLCRVGSKVQTLRAHNVPADRTKIYESYQISDNICWADTMANHTLLSGPCSGQSMLMRQVAAGKLHFKPWFMDSTSLKNILAVHNFWLPEAEPLLPQDKKIRDIFYKGSMAEIRTSFVELMNYSLKDASLVNQIYDAQQKAWSRQVPSEIRTRAALLRANVSLAISPDFEDWLAVCEKEYQKSSNELNNLADELVKAKVKDFSDELRSSLSVDLQPLPSWFTKSGKLMKKWQCSIKQNLAINPATQDVVLRWNLKYASRDWEPAPTAEPKWYGIAKKKGISYSQTIVQDLCDLTYFGQEVVYDREQKFMFRNSNGILAKVFSPKKGPATKDNCGSLFGADFVQLFEDGSLQSQNPIAQKITSTAAELSYWTSVRARLQIIKLQRLLFKNTTV